MCPDAPGAEGGEPGAGRKTPAPDSPGDLRESQKLPKTHRLRKRGEFRRVQDRGQRFTSGAVILLILPNTLGHRRLGVTASTRVGNAVVRARVKRWFREIFRKNRELLPPSVDVVLIARSGAPEAGLHRLEADFRKLAAAAGSKRVRGPGPARNRDPGGS